MVPAASTPPVDAARVEALISALDPAELEQAFEAEVGLGSSAAGPSRSRRYPPRPRPDEAVAAERVAEAPTPGGDAARRGPRRRRPRRQLRLREPDAWYRI